MAVEIEDVQLTFIFSIICAIFFHLFHANETAEWIYYKINWLFATAMIVVLIPDEIIPKKIKLVCAWGFGFDLFMMIEGGRPSPDPEQLIFTICAKTVHHLSVLCNTTLLEQICYGCCWLLHAFAITKFFGKNVMVKSFKIGNYTPLIVLVQYIYFYVYYTDIDYIALGINKNSFYIQFMIAIQMVCYRYLYVVSSYDPSYPPWTNNYFKTVFKYASKVMVYAFAIGFAVLAIAPEFIF